MRMLLYLLNLKKLSQDINVMIGYRQAPEWATMELEEMKSKLDNIIEELSWHIRENYPSLAKKFNIRP